MKNHKILKILGNLDALLAGAAVVALVVLTLSGIIVRYCFNSPFAWLEEVTSACFLWSVLMGACIAFREKAHVAIEILVVSLPKKLQRIAEVLIMVVSALLLIYLTYQAIQYVGTVAGANRMTGLLRLPYGVIYGILPISSIWMLCNLIYAFVKDVRSWKNSGEQEVEDP